MSNNIVLQNKVQHQATIIMTLAKKLFECKLNSNPNNFTYDEEHCERRLGIKTKNIEGTISLYERDNDYTLRVCVRGYRIVITEYSGGRVSFYIDDGDYGKIEDYDDDDIINCFCDITGAFTELLKIVNYVPKSEKYATDKDYLEIAVEACKKFNEEFEGTFDSL